MKTSFASRISSFAIVAVAAAGAAIMANAADSTVASLDNPNGTTTVNAGDTIIVTGNVTQTTDTDAGRFNKAGDGTLILKGANNTFKRMTHSAGKLVFDGGATTVSGGSGSGAGTSMNVVLDGDETVVTGGGSFNIGSGSQYAGFRSKDMVVTNGTVDATAVTGELLCNFTSNPMPTRKGRGVVTVGKDGLFRAAKMRPHQGATATYKDSYGFEVRDGGVLEITAASGVKLDGTQYGFMKFDGGVFRNSATEDSTFPGGGTWTQSPISIGPAGMTLDNQTTRAWNIARPLVSGAAADGGLHTMGRGYLFINAGDSTFNGGLFLDSNNGLLVRVDYDTSLGAASASPTDAVFVRGSNTALFTRYDLELSANRNFLVSSNRNFNVIANTGKTLTIHGEIGGEREPGTLPTTTRLYAGYKWTPTGNTWKGGLVVLDPGEGRTNNVGRFTIEGNTEIKSGTTLVNGVGLNDSAPLYVHGSGAADATIGTLTVSGGEIVVSPESSSKFVQVGYYNVDNGNYDYGLLDVCGGTVKTSGGEFLNALGAGLTIIRDGGVIDCGGGNFRMAQYMTDNQTVVRLATNGLLRCNQVSLDYGKGTVATFLFDGGYLHPTVNNNSFCSSGLNAAWDNITFAVGAGGAGFEVESGNNVWIYRQLVSGVAAGETDGGLMARGPAGAAVVLMTNMTYNGATTVDGCTLQQRVGDNLLPSGTHVILKNKGELHTINYQTDKSHSAATLGGIEGDGVLRGSSKLDITGDIAPSIGGTIELDSTPKSLSGPIAITGDNTGCGKVKFGQSQSLNGLTLSVSGVNSFSTAAEDKRLYKIVEGNYSGEFSNVTGLNDDWHVSYKPDGVYLTHQDAFTIVIR